MSYNAAQIGQAVANGLQAFGDHSAQAANAANGVSKQAQAAQGQFNSEQANLANSIGTDRIISQYDYNSAQAAQANQFALDSWNQAAAWNEAMWQKNADWQEKMWQKSADFNHQEAEISRGWQEEMMRTAYQRAVKDMSAAGLNPILAVTGGGISTGSGSGTAASIGAASSSAPQMSALAGHSASGGLMNGISANEGNYTGQMEYMGGMLGLLSAAIGGISSAMQAFGGMGEVGKSLAEGLAGIFNPSKGSIAESFGDYYKKGRANQENKFYKPNYRNGIDWNMKNYDSILNK